MQTDSIYIGTCSRFNHLIIYSEVEVVKPFIRSCKQQNVQVVIVLLHN